MISFINKNKQSKSICLYVKKLNPPKAYYRLYLPW